MGQQQLLLLVLGIVIVGIAVVAGIQAFSEGKAKSERDAAASDAMRIVSDVQAWNLKPVAFGGGAGSTTKYPNFKNLGYPTADIQADSSYRTVSGCYEIAAGAGTGSKTAQLSIYLKDPDVTDGGCLATAFATVDIDGSTSDDIVWTYN